MSDKAKVTIAAILVLWAIASGVALMWGRQLGVDAWLASIPAWVLFGFTACFLAIILVLSLQRRSWRGYLLAFVLAVFITVAFGLRAQKNVDTQEGSSSNGFILICCSLPLVALGWWLSTVWKREQDSDDTPLGPNGDL